MVGNKNDRIDERVVDFELGKKYADSLRIPFIETSAKNGFNVEQAFMIMASNIKKKVESRPDTSSKPTVNLTHKVNPEKSGCSC